MAGLVARHLRQVKSGGAACCVVILVFSLINVGQLDDDQSRHPLLSGTVGTSRTFTTVEVTQLLTGKK